MTDPGREAARTLLLVTERVSRRRRGREGGTAESKPGKEELGEAEGRVAGEGTTVAMVEEEWEDAGEDEGRGTVVGVTGVDEAIASAFLGISSVKNLAGMGRCEHTTGTGRVNCWTIETRRRNSGDDVFSDLVVGCAHRNGEVH